jgi:hypothetical protein
MIGESSSQTSVCSLRFEQAAMIAAAIGQRRDRTDRHPMSGAIKRRVEQFSCFADGAICASTERPDRVVEMTLSQDDMAYELQNDKKAMV